MSAAPILVPAELPDDPRIWKLAAALQCRVAEALGHLLMLYCGMSTGHSAGNIDAVPNDIIARWAGWAREPGHFAAALVDAGFLLNDGTVVGWENGLGREAKRREADAARKAQHRSRPSSGRKSSGQSPGQSYGRSDVMSEEISQVLKSEALAALGLSVKEEGGLGGDGGETAGAYQEKQERTRASRNVPDLLEDLFGNQAGTIEPGEEALDIDETMFELCWQEYPARAGGNSKTDARKAFIARLRDKKAPADPNDLLAGTRRYAAYCEAMDMVGTQYVKTAATFFGPGRHYEDPFEIPASKRGRPAPQQFEYQPTTEIPSFLRGRQELPPNPDPGF